MDTAGTIKVLVADDHPAFRDGLCRAISGTDDLEVIATADDGEQAVRLAQESVPDVAVISITLPKLDGITVAKQIKAASPKTSIIMVSAYDQGSYIATSLRAGALGYLCKTSPVDELINCIRTVNTGETVFDSRAAGKLLRLLLAEPIDETKYIEKLHDREMEVIKLVAKGMHNRDIATELHISEHTVHSHLTTIFRKLGVNSRTEAVLHA